MDDELEPMQAAMDDDQVLRCYYRMFAWGIALSPTHTQARGYVG
jgi:hypothetical protein